MSQVQIIGAGFSGLSLGYFLTKLGVKVSIYESRDRVGGLIQTVQHPFGLIETAANGLLLNDTVSELFRDLNIQFAVKHESAGRRLIYRDGFKKWPLGIGATLIMLFKFVTNKILFRFAPIKNESVIDWGSRVFGSEFTKYLLAPALNGIYGTSDLSAELIYRAFRSAKGSKVTTVAPDKGMSELIDSMKKYIVDHGGEVITSTMGDVRLSKPTVLATSATAAAMMLVEVAPELSRQLSKVKYLPLTTATFFYDLEVPSQKAFGCLFPAPQKFNALGVLFNSYIFQNRSNCLSETWMFGKVGMKESELLDCVSTDRERIFGQKCRPKAYRVTEWPAAVPHYSCQLKEVIDQLKPPPQIYLTGNYLGALGLAKILNYNKTLASTVYEDLAIK